MKYKFGFNCKLCGYKVKQLYGCTLTYEGKSVDVMACERCMRRLGLKEKPREEENVGKK